MSTLSLPPRWGVWALAFVLVATGLFLLTVRRGDGSVQLTGGSTARVIGVTFGTNHVLETGPPWAKLAHRLGARGVASRFGYKEYSAPWPDKLPCLMVWVVFTNPSTNPIPRYASVANLQGAETEPGYQAAGVTLPQTNMTIAAWRFENFPRRQRRLRVRFYEYDLFQVRSRYEGELTVQNPAIVFTSAPLPAPSSLTLRKGPLECSLLALRRAEPPPLTAKKSPAEWASAEFALRENNRPTTAWTVRRFEAMGADGNRIAPLRPVAKLADGERVVRFPGPLWPDEPDWDVTAVFFRTRDFPAESLWTVRLPLACFLNATFTTNLTVVVGDFGQDVTLDLRAGFPRGAPHRSSLAVNYRSVAPDWRVDLARVSDDHGHDVRLSEPASLDYGQVEARLELPDGTMQVDVTFALHRNRQFTFRVQPTHASTNSAPTSAANPNQQ